MDDRILNIFEEGVVGVAGRFFEGLGKSIKMPIRSSQLVGTWRLRSLELAAVDNSFVHRFDPRVQGYLVYTADGYVCVTIQDAILKLPGLDPASIHNIPRFMANTGRYELQGDVVIHHPNVCYLPNGLSNERYLDLEGDRLTSCTGPFPALRSLVSGRMVWERVR